MDLAVVRRQAELRRALSVELGAEVLRERHGRVEPLEEMAAPRVARSAHHLGCGRSRGTELCSCVSQGEFGLGWQGELTASDSKTSHNQRRTGKTTQGMYLLIGTPFLVGLAVGKKGFRGTQTSDRQTARDEPSRAHSLLRNREIFCASSCSYMERRKNYCFTTCHQIPASIFILPTHGVED